jgi:hypothetical protein
LINVADYTAVSLNPEFVEAIYCGLQILAVPTRRDFTILFLNIIMTMPASHRIHALRQKPRGMYENIKINYRIAESYQIAPTARFATPRYDAYCKIWVKNYCRVLLNRT